MLNRRHIIGGAAALPAIVIASCGAAPAMTSTLSPDFAAMLNAAETARAVAKRYDADTYLPKVQAAAKAIDSIPHTAVTVAGNPNYFTTANPTIVQFARDVVEGDPQRRHPDSAALRRLIAADIRRSRGIQCVNARFDIDTAGERSDGLWTACTNAENAAAMHPVSTAPDLAAKLAFMVDRQMGDGMDWLEELHADARRVAKLEG